MSVGPIIKYLEKNTNAGQLFSVSDSAARHTPGSIYIDDETGAVFQYLYNATGGACVAGVFYWKYLTTAGKNPAVKALTPTANEVGELAIAQAAIPSTYYGWFLIQGPTTASDVAMYWDSVDQNGTDTCEDGQAFTITDGIAACTDAAATFPTDVPRTEVGVCIEDVSAAATSVDVYLYGGLVKAAT